MTKERALQLLQENVQNENLRRHCYGVGFALVGIREYLENENRLETPSASVEDWEVLGILHDSDYELTKDDWTKHTLITLEWLDKEGMDKNDPIYRAIETHNSNVTNLRSPQTQMEWALECCDELTGFIVAYTLILPSKKLSDVTVEGVKKKFRQPAFARNVHREQIEQCGDRLQIPLDTFIEIVLNSMKKHASELGL